MNCQKDQSSNDFPFVTNDTKDSVDDQFQKIIVKNIGLLYDHEASKIKYVSIGEKNYTHEQMHYLLLLAARESDIDVLDVDENESDELKTLLTSWGVEVLYPYFQKCQITIESMELIEEQDYTVLMENNCEMFGVLVIFRKFHREFIKTAKDDANKVDVRNILECAEGDDIKDFFKTNNKFTHAMRLKLGYLILTGRKVSRLTMNDIAEQIILIFPGELKEHFYEKRRGVPATGVLIVCFNALSGKTRAAKSKSKTIQPAEANTNSSISLTIERIESDEPADNEEAVLSDDVRASIDFLNDEANMLNQEQIKHHWEVTSEYRRRKTYETASEAIEDWLPLQQHYGGVLIHYDFVKKYGNERANPLSGFGQFVLENDETFFGEIKNSLIKRKLSEAYSDTASYTQTHDIMMALFHTNCMVPVMVSTKKSTWTPTILESQNAFCITVVRSEDIEKQITRRRAVLQMKGMEEHPIIFHVSSKKEFYVRYRSLFYKGGNFLDAVDTAFKIFAFYKIPYPLDSSKVWHFLNAVFFKIQLHSPPTSEFISKMSVFKY